MSARNGDKARFGRERQRKLLRRVRSRELRKALENKAGTGTKVTSGDGPKAPERPQGHRDKEASSRTAAPGAGEQRATVDAEESPNARHN